MRLAAHQMEQRLDTVRGAFQRLGQVTISDTVTAPRTLVIEIEHPGWGADRVARMWFVETWLREDDSWDLFKYAYDLMMDPGPDRYGYHWHDGLHHTHCQTSDAPLRDHHFEGEPVDLFDAFDAFTDYLVGRRVLSCTDLTPLR